MHGWLYRGRGLLRDGGVVGPNQNACMVGYIEVAVSYEMAVSLAQTKMHQMQPQSSFARCCCVQSTFISDDEGTGITR